MRFRWLLGLVLGISTGLLMAGAGGIARADDLSSNARFSVVQGQVTVRGAHGAQAAATEMQLFPGDYVETGPTARAEVTLGGGDAALRFAGGVQAHVIQAGQLQLADGTVEVSILHGGTGTMQIDTPSVTIRAAQKGVYRIAITSSGATQVDVRSGSVDVVTPHHTYTVASGKAIVASGSADNPSVSDATAVAYDSFDHFIADRDSALQNASSDYGYQNGYGSGYNDGSWSGGGYATTAYCSYGGIYPSVGYYGWGWGFSFGYGYAGGCGYPVVSININPWWWSPWWWGGYAYCCGYPYYGYGYGYPYYGYGYGGYYPPYIPPVRNRYWPRPIHPITYPRGVVIGAVPRTTDPIHVDPIHVDPVHGAPIAGPVAYHPVSPVMGGPVGTRQPITHPIAMTHPRTMPVVTHPVVTHPIDTHPIATHPVALHPVTNPIDTKPGALHPITVKAPVTAKAPVTVKAPVETNAWNRFDTSRGTHLASDAPVVHSAPQTTASHTSDVRGTSTQWDRFSNTRGDVSVAPDPHSQVNPYAGVEHGMGDSGGGWFGSNPGGAGLPRGSAGGSVPTSGMHGGLPGGSMHGAPSVGPMSGAPVHASGGGGSVHAGGGGGRPPR